MTTYDETRCYAPVGEASGPIMYCGSPAKRKDANGRPLCGRCKAPDLGWMGERGNYPEGSGGEWAFLRNPPAPKPWALTVANVSKGLREAGVAMTTNASGLKARKVYGRDDVVAIDYRMPLGGVRLGTNDIVHLFDLAYDALAARGLTLVMVDDRHATVTETKP